MNYTPRQDGGLDDGVLGKVSATTTPRAVCWDNCTLTGQSGTTYFLLRSPPCLGATLAKQNERKPASFCLLAELRECCCQERACPRPESLVPDMACIDDRCYHAPVLSPAALLAHSTHGKLQCRGTGLSWRADYFGGCSRWLEGPERGRLELTYDACPRAHLAVLMVCGRSSPLS